MIRYRPLRWPRDRIDKLDTSFTTSAVLEVRITGSGFELLEVAADPPREKRYALAAADLASEESIGIVAESPDGIVGVAVIRHEEWNRTALLSHLYVDREARGRGIGSGLLREVRRTAESLEVRAIRVETQTVNLPAVRFYRSQGFALTGFDLGLYDPGEVGDEAAIFLSMPM
jgi:ribosomal protein S18 acetylase RimI-like enzyme